MNRDFKGIWIPREIWLHPTLSMQAKLLWAEIDSLHDPERGGCYASDEYLIKFLGVKVSRLHEVFKELKEAGLLQKVSYDGRCRIIKALHPKTDDGGSLTSGKPEVSVPENRKSHPYILDTSGEKSIATNDLPPKKAPGQKISFNYETGEFSNITGKHRELFKKAYPLVNLDSEIPKATLWLLNPKNKKKKDFEAFLNNWFSNAQKELEVSDNRIKTFNNLNKKTSHDMKEVPKIEVDPEMQKLIDERNAAMKKGTQS